MRNESLSMDYDIRKTGRSCASSGASRRFTFTSVRVMTFVASATRNDREDRTARFVSPQRTRLNRTYRSWNGWRTAPSLTQGSVEELETEMSALVVGWLSCR